ncbi:hypothetical protein HmCmsJML007_03286 [Escherichia coli]|nr:hypothetical protein HmCmsJML007_03286 [Escherichia coli]
MFTGKHFAGTTKFGVDLVGHQKDTFAIAHFADSF